MSIADSTSLRAGCRAGDGVFPVKSVHGYFYQPQNYVARTTGVFRSTLIADRPLTGTYNGFRPETRTSTRLSSIFAGK